MTTRLLSIVALTVACQGVRAYVLIDDFQAGPYTKTFSGTGQEFHQVFGLDTDHSAFGDRTTFFHVVSNLNHVPVTMDVGQGRAVVFTPQGQSAGVSTVFQIDLGLSTPIVPDFSQDKEFWMDIDVKKPDGRFADLWRVVVSDTSGTVGQSTGWLSRPGGIRFRFTGFVGGVDFSKIRDFRFEQQFDSQGAPHPESYSVTRVYAVRAGVTEVAPTALAILTGKGQSGTVASLALQDGDNLVVCRFIVPNQAVPPVSVQFDGVLPLVPSGLWLRSVVSMASGGLFQATYDLWDWIASAYDDGTTFALGTSSVKCEVTPTGDFHRYVDASREVRARIRITNVGPTADFAWCAKLDQLVWEAVEA